MEISENYLTNRVTGEIGQATAIYFPTSQEEVVAIMLDVRKNQQKLITIGGHTGLSGATFPDDHQVLMSLEKLNRIIKLDTETMTLNSGGGSDDCRNLRVSWRRHPTFMHRTRGVRQRVLVGMQRPTQVGCEQSNMGSHGTISGRCA
jgi:hypothetical protein